jgi:lycopene beta-cyclase
MAGSLREEIKCDIIIAGAGLAGLSLLYRAMKQGIWTDVSIVVVDEQLGNPAQKNWSFWKKFPGPFDDLICHQWHSLSFFNAVGEETNLTVGDYTYNTIRSIDFHLHCMSYLRAFKNINFVAEKVLEVHPGSNNCYLNTPNRRYKGSYLFNSIYIKPVLKPGSQYFLQHFRGLMIKSSQFDFLDDQAYLMDFRTSQEHGASFFYTLPFAPDEAFIEYTIFSKKVLTLPEYEEKIYLYLKEVLHITEFTVMDQEYGVIPMTDHHFKRFEGNIINIGSAGGDTRGSTGYTFSNVQLTVSHILASWQSKEDPFFSEEVIGIKHRLYDATLLQVLDDGTYKGHQVFEDLFKATKAERVFSFLDANSSWLEELGLISSLRPLPFLKAMISVLFRNLRH